MTRARSLLRTTRSLTSTLAAAVLLAIAAMLGAAAPAHADTAFDQAVSALRSGETVYVAPGADPTMTDAQAADLRARISRIGLPFHIAVLPVASAVGGTPDSTLKALYDAVKFPGTYALYIGNAFRAGNTSSSVSGIATVSYQQHHADGVYAVLDSFVADVGQKLAGKSGSTPPFAAIGAVVVAAIAALGGGMWLAARSKRKRDAERTAAVRVTVDEDVTEFGEKVAALDVNDPRLDDAGRADAQRALDAYEQAKTAADRMQRPEDAATVTTALEDGRFALACVDARANGQPVPKSTMIKGARRASWTRVTDRARSMSSGRLTVALRVRSRCAQPARPPSPAVAFLRPARSSWPVSRCPTGRAVGPTRRTPAAISATAGPTCSA